MELLNGTSGLLITQISSSYPDMLARGRVWTAYSWAHRKLQSEIYQCPQFFPYSLGYSHSFYLVLNFQCVHSWIYSHSFYLTHCSTNSGAFGASLQLGSLRTIL